MVRSFKSNGAKGEAARVAPGDVCGLGERVCGDGFSMAGEQG
jgi:hypothetical protein